MDVHQHDIRRIGGQAVESCFSAMVSAGAGESTGALDEYAQAFPHAIIIFHNGNVNVHASELGRLYSAHDRIITVDLQIQSPILVTFGTKDFAFTGITMRTRVPLGATFSKVKSPPLACKRCRILIRPSPL